MAEATAMRNNVSLADGQEGFCHARALAETGKNGVSVDAETFSPFRDAKRQPVVRKQSVGSLVAILLQLGRPAAVARFVVAVVVGVAINGVLGRGAWSNIRQERLERIAPAVADRNAPAAVIVMPLGIVVVAPLNHGAPSFVFGCCKSATRPIAAVPVNRIGPVASGGGFGVVAAATLGFVADEVGCWDDGFITAPASAMPLMVPAFPPGVFDHGPSVERPICQVTKPRIGGQRSRHSAVSLEIIVGALRRINNAKDCQFTACVEVNCG